MKKQPTTKKDIIPMAPKQLPLRRIHAIMIGLAKPTLGEQMIVAACITLIADGASVNAFKHMSADERMALDKLSSVELFDIN